MTFYSLIPPVVCLTLLGGLFLEKSSWPVPEDVSGYHTAIQQTVDALPAQVGDWTATEVPLPAAAVKLLRPNAILSRSYRNQITGRSFSLLIVHCRDARDMIGHYPPVCYPAHGWQMVNQSPVVSPATQRDLQGNLYKFKQILPGVTAVLHVYNLLLLPDGTFGNDMNDVNRVAADRQFRIYGAAQVQFVFDDATSENEQQAVLEQFSDALLPVVDQILMGKDQDVE